MFYGLPDGYVRIECDRITCTDWYEIVPPHSTLVDIERTMKRHIHRRATAA